MWYGMRRSFLLPAPVRQIKRNIKVRRQMRESRRQISFAIRYDSVKMKKEQTNSFLKQKCDKSYLMI
jgi:hypothetical protein